MALQFLKNFGWACLWATAIVLLALTILFVPVVGGLGEAMLWPGDVLPRSYWGALHDPLQLLAGLVLNWIFYFVIVLVVLMICNPAKRSRRYQR